MSTQLFLSAMAVLVAGASGAAPSKYALPKERPYNGAYEGANLNRIAFPIGGIGAGMFCIEGTGAISHMSVRNKMEFFHEPCMFVAVCVKGDANVARVLEGPIPDWKYFGGPGTGNGATGATYGFPRFTEAKFLARFPFATIDLKDGALPLDVTLTAWSPFTPGDADNSSLPVGALEYAFTNTSSKNVEAVFSFNTKNFMSGGPGNGVDAFPKGFVLRGGGPDNPESFAIFVDADDVVVDHCWFKGGWWDAMTLAWRNVAQATLMNNPPVKGSVPGASLFVPFDVAPGKTKTIRLMTAWYAGETKLRIGTENKPAFESGPAQGTAKGQQEVTGFLGERLINSFSPSGDGPTGTLTSAEFNIKDRYIHFLIAGGSNKDKVGLRLLVDSQSVRADAGKDTENLEWKSWDVGDLQGKTARLCVVDESSAAWGHVCLDEIVFSEKPISELTKPGSNELKTDRGITVFEDFEKPKFDGWEAKAPGGSEQCETPRFYRPWYAGRFENVDKVAAYWRENYDSLRERSALFRDTFYDTTLPPEVIEAVAANLTILKSPTVLRQPDGRLWCFEGCGDDNGCCHGSCTHVWNYAQAISHLFPDLERSLRNTEYTEGLFPDGKQAFRMNLPISPGGTDVSASDGQLGGIMKMYREWRISGDTEWIKRYWPRMRLALDYMIATWDPRETGLLEESHHNTYDIAYFGPDGHCGSFYLGALTAAIKIGEYLGDDVGRYRTLRDKGIKRLDSELFNGEYYYQKIMTNELKRPPELINPLDNSEGYRPVVELLNQQSPKYQYGTGCLSDGVLGFWIARMCGIDEEIVDPLKVQSHLNSVYKYNLKRDLVAHANPQRPSFAMGNDGGLLLCTWPRGGALAIPFVYSDEVWTGIEYQAASHLMIEGMTGEGLDIVRVCRDRYDGVRRNPFNEYECGHWYARAMSSYGLLQGLTGARYDAVDGILYINSKVGNFRSFLSTATGYGTVGLKHGKPFIDVKSGTINVKRFVVDGKEVVAN